MSEKFLVSGREFERIIKAVQRAAAKNNDRSQLAGIHLEARESTLTAVAADGYRLSESRATLIEPVASPHVATLDKTLLLAFVKLPSKGDIPVMIDPGVDAWVFSQASGVITVPVIAGTYPDHKQIIGGGEFVELFHVNAKFLTDALAAHGAERVSFGRGARSKEGALSPIYITQKEQYGGGLTRHIIMPMQAGTHE
jgi:DNA polymerase III sliding clamp (beta) subunit (PCNA family)